MVQGCFLALPLPDDQIQLFQQMQTELKSLSLQVKYQKEDTPHLTLLFFGQIHEEKLEKVIAKTETIVQSVQPFELTIQGIGYFGSERYPRVAWLGAEVSQSLIDLQTEIRQTLGVHCQKKDDRPFHAHLTIARIESAKKFLAAKADFEEITKRYTFSFQPDRIRLYAAFPAKGERQVPIMDFAFAI